MIHQILRYELYINKNDGDHVTYAENVIFQERA